MINNILEQNMKKNNYKSKFEQKIADDLIKKKVKVDYETLKLKYVIPESNHIYTPDFILPNGIVVETKGKFDLKDRKKMLLVIEQHPELDIRMLFQRAKNPIRKGSKTSYSDWCDKNNIKWADREIPKSWYSE